MSSRIGNGVAWALRRMSKVKQIAGGFPVASASPGKYAAVYVGQMNNI